MYLTRATQLKKGITLRMAIAQELYDAEEDKVKAEWVRKMEEYERVDEKFQEAKKGELSSDPDNQKE